MKIPDRTPSLACIVATALFCPLISVPVTGQPVPSTIGKIQKAPLSTHIVGAQKINPTTVEIIFSDAQRMAFDFYGENIFRVFEDTSGNIIRDPLATPPAQILVGNPRSTVSQVSVKDQDGGIRIATANVLVSIDKNSSLITVTNKRTGKTVLQTLQPVLFEKGKVSLVLKAHPDEYFYGGGVQNGRFSHKGKSIAIENQNSWTDNGVASPAPFYWSTNGYGVMWYTFKQGKYDFGAKEKDIVTLTHHTNYLDVFFMVNDGAVALLKDFYQLTGNPILLPKFGFYEGHLNAYNRDYWKEDPNGILFEDHKRYKESQKDNGGTKESLNGEKNNYQFSARAVIDRYKSHDMPLGWILPNDGYGAGYGQAGTLDSNIANLKSFGDYARKNGVQIGLWTQSDLHPKEGVSALLQRDIVKEVRDAGVRVLKTDVAWVGPGYSFGLNGVSEVGGHIMPYYGNNARPFIISLDGWAGTQRYAGVWSGDQTGGQWEYIRFHIPTYIGSGLSGQPNITSDMDGIFGGKNPVVNIRDFQWKTFTPMQLNMDGWGSNEKYPHALGEPATSINRNYLKWKAQLIPYTYSVAKEAVNGLPIIRAMFLEKENAYTLGKATQYQYLYGPFFLIAPIYQETKPGKEGQDIRNNIYLPEGVWYDYFSGEKYTGGKVINSFDVPLWKLPVFVKAGAIIPMANANNHVSEINRSLRIYEVYPWGKSSFTEYDDDGNTEAYKYGKGVSTLIESNLDKSGNATITVQTTKGSYDGFVKNKATEFRVNVSARPRNITAKIGGKSIVLSAVTSLADFGKRNNVYYYDAAPDLNQFATRDSAFAKVRISKNPLLLAKVAATDVTSNSVSVTLSGYRFTRDNPSLVKSGKLDMPTARISAANTTAYTLTPTWDLVPNADFYEIEYNGMLYSTIRDTAFVFDGLTPVTDYAFKLRAVNSVGASDWKVLTAKTSVNPLEFAIKGISARSTATDEEGNEISKLFDFDEDNLWHTAWDKKAVPLSMVIDLKSVNQLDKLEYLPRMSGANGIIMAGKVAYSMNKETWTDAGDFTWARTPAVKTISFPSHPTARYIKLDISQAYKDFGSGREIYVFKVPGTESVLPGDINNDHKIDNNDLTSYTNYTGLRKGDGDFDGYISNGDINQNGLIDAYDISVVATQLDGGISEDAANTDSIGGKLELVTSKKEYAAGETIEILVKGNQLKNVNALSFALPYNPADYEYAGIQPLNMNVMENLTYDRLHSNGQKALYPTFVNIGEKDVLNGSQDLFILRFKAKRKTTANFPLLDGILVDRNLDSVRF